MARLLIISHENIDAFINALQYAKENGTNLETDSGLDDSGDPVNPPPPTNIPPQ